jgi:hypothetical protein
MKEIFTELNTIFNNDSRSSFIDQAKKIYNENYFTESQKKIAEQFLFNPNKDTAIEALKGGKGKTKDDPEFAELQRQVSKLTKSMDALKKEKDVADKAVIDEKNKRHAMLTKTELLSQLTEGKAIKPATLVVILQKFVKVGDDEKLVFVNEVGDEVSVKDGVAGWLKANPEFVTNTGTGGAGSNGGPGGGTKTEEEAAKALADARNKGQQGAANGLNPWAATPAPQN